LGNAAAIYAAAISGTKNFTKCKAMKIIFLASQLVMRKQRALI
jgi:hypothetical protein